MPTISVFFVMRRNSKKLNKMISKHSVWMWKLPCMMEISTISTVWTFSLNLGCYGKFPWRYWYCTSSPSVSKIARWLLPKHKIIYSLQSQLLWLQESEVFQNWKLLRIIWEQLWPERLGGLTLLFIRKDVASSINYNDHIAESAANKLKKFDFV